MEKINSKEYWENRFSTDWNEYSGNEQTKYFATVLGELLPEWLLHEVNENKYPVCDLGCAEGDALQIYKRFFMTSEITGEDFSEKAIETAKTRYPEFAYKVSNILEPEGYEKYPVVVCSNVVEHFKETYKVIECVCKRATKYSIILIPYREEEGKIDEHEKTFHTKDIPMQVEDNKLVYAKSVSCDSIYYPYEQLLLVYAKGDKFSLLSEVVENVCSDRETNHVNEKELDIQKLEKELQDSNNCVEVYKQTVQEKDKAIEEKDKAIEAKDQAIAVKNQEIATKDQAIAAKDQEIARLKQELMENMNKQTLAINNDEWAKLQQSYEMMKAVMRQKDEYMLHSIELCDMFAATKSMKLIHLKNRIIRQLLKGTKEDRADFWDWMKNRKSGSYRTSEKAIFYNPLAVIRKKMTEGIACRANSVSVVPTIQTNAVTESGQPVSVMAGLPMETKEILHQNYKKSDIIILSVIDYNFRHQRPQHFATRFAANGHRVYYVNANFIRPDSITEEQENLYIVDFLCQEANTIYAMNGQDCLSWMNEKLEQLIYTQAIRDAVIVVDYPNWVYGAEAIREKYGFKIVTDYMDDYTGFLGTAEDYVKDNCIRLLEKSDAVVASSQFLFDVASKYTDAEKITIVRNGTEVEHFYQAVNLGTPNKKRKVIGYYGAVAHWFSWEKICYLAKKYPEYDIVIVGEVTEYRNKLEKHSNIKLLGEKAYKDLPQYLADFDVCLIPFDTSTDLIKATNPVKFYEYLSAGKKVVATEIPELMPFRDEYVYMSNDDEEFAKYVQMCLEGTDTLKDADTCIQFAKENDWQHRYECFEEACVKAIPGVSVIVLTYNNLALNKNCIRSILDKTAYANYELIIVDNQSTDGTRDYLKELEQKNIPNVKIIFNEENSGFAGGNNLGIEKSSGKYVLLLNNDTMITRGWLTAMTKHLENNSKYGMCNPVTNSIGNESKIRVDYTNERELDEFAYGYTASQMNKEYKDVDRLPLFATMIRKEAIDKLGALDHSYKVGMFEDDDYTEKIVQGGYEITIVEDAFIHHVNNASFKKLDSEEYKKIFEENKAIFESKWNKKWKMPKYREGVFPNCNDHSKFQ